MLKTAKWLCFMVEYAVWVVPKLVCTVKYMMKTESGGLRQPVFKGLREDKAPEECRCI